MHSQGNTNILGFISLVLVLAFILCIPAVKADVLTETTSVTVTATVPSQSGSGSSGSGGSSGVSNSISTDTTTDATTTIDNLNVTELILKGVAYPDSSVSLTKDGVLASSVTADPSGRFVIDLSGLTAGTYSLGIRAQKGDSPDSVSKQLSIYVADGVTTTVNNILIPPTIDVDKDKAKKGDPISIFGYSIPDSTVSIIIGSTGELHKSTTSDTSGSWSYELETYDLEYGDYSAKARSEAGTEISDYSDSVDFSVGEETIIKDPDPAAVAGFDLNDDNRVNITDFSILAYWYKRSSPIAGVDFNKDGKVDLVDFSILAYKWTG